MTTTMSNRIIKQGLTVYRRSWRSISTINSTRCKCIGYVPATVTDTAGRAATSSSSSSFLISSADRRRRTHQCHYWVQQQIFHHQQHQPLRSSSTISFLGIPSITQSSSSSSFKPEDDVPTMPPRQYQVQKETAAASHLDLNHDNDDYADGNSNHRMLSNQQHLSRKNDTRTTTSTDLTVGRLRRLEVEEFLNTPIGSLTPSSWMKAERLADQLGGGGGVITSTIGDGKNSNENDDYHALVLLERLGREPDSNIRLSNETVHSIVSNWKNNLRNRSRSSFNNDKNIGAAAAAREEVVVRPSIVWKAMLDLDRRGVQLESSIFTRIIEGTQYLSSHLMSPDDGPYLAEKILNWMMDDGRIKDNPLIRPDASTFEAVMGSWGTPATAGNNSKEAPERSLVLLKKLKTLYDSGWGQEFMPTKSVYKRVMLLYAHQGDGDMVESLLEDLYAFYLDRIEEHPHLRGDLELELSPSTEFFSLVLYAWSVSDDSFAAERAEMILEQMLDLESTGELQNLFVTAKCFNIVMIAWGRKRVPESPLKCQALFDRMLQLSKDNNLGREKRRGSKEPLAMNSRSKAPSAGSYLSLITTWARFDSKKAEDVYREWKKQHSLGNVDMRVDSSLFETIVMAVNASNAPDGAQICDRWIQIALEDDIISPCKLDALVFSTTINAWCQTKTREGIIRAEELLCLLRDRHNSLFPSDNCAAPTVHCYLPVVQGWADMFGDVEKAEELVLEWMSLDPSMKQQRRRRRGGRRSMDTNGGQTKRFRDDNELDTRLFNICIKGWMKLTSTDPNAPHRAESLLLSMEKHGIRPNAASFKYVLNAWRDRSQRQVRRWTIGMNNQKPPRAHEVVFLLDRMYKQGALGVTNESYLSLRQGWNLLAVE